RGGLSDDVGPERAEQRRAALRLGKERLDRGRGTVAETAKEGRVLHAAFFVGNFLTGEVEGDRFHERLGEAPARHAERGRLERVAVDQNVDSDRKRGPGEGV